MHEIGREAFEREGEHLAEAERQRAQMAEEPPAAHESNQRLNLKTSVLSRESVFEKWRRVLTRSDLHIDLERAYSRE